MTASTLIAACERIAAATPDAVAVEDACGSSTFAEVLGAAGDLAEAIRASGTPLHAAVGIELPAGPSYVVAVLAARMAARACLLLDPHHPSSRNAVLASAAGCGLFIEQGEDPGRADVRRRSRVRLRRASSDAPGGNVPDDVHVVLGTSGSRGTPKCVAHADASMMAWANGTILEVGLLPIDVVLTLSSPATLGGIVGITSGLLSGATQRFADLAGRGLPAVIDAFRDGRVSCLRATPSLIVMMSVIPGFLTMARRLRSITLYGEPLSWDDVDALRRVLPEACRIRTTYGSTEAGGTSWFLGTRPEGGGRVHAGRPLPEVTVTIVDPEGSPVRAEAAGEVIIGGPANSLGILVDGRFVPHPASPNGLPTGDLGRLRADGSLEILERLDRGVKINGVRIDLTEIEIVIAAYPGVRRVEVVAVSRTGGLRLCAFVETDRDQPAAADIERHARTQLPGSTAPRVIVLEALPMLPVGKVDLRRLTELAEATV